MTVARERRVRAADRARSPSDERRRRAEEALELVRLPGYGARKPAQLSGGQRQRVALARAIVNRPQVLLLDEPLGALDLKLRQEMQVELKRIQGEVGITFVYVTHDQEEALTMSDRLAVFNDGRIEQVGAPAEVYEHPANDVRRRLRRRLERARARRPALHVRPGEDPRARDARAPTACTSRRAASRDVGYAGMVTRYVVALDAGGELQVVRQNLETSSAEALEERGPAGSGRLARRAHVRDRQDRGGGSMKRGPWDGGRRARARRCRSGWSPAAATTRTAAAAVERQRRGQGARGPEDARPKLGEGEGKVNLIAWAGYVEDGSTDPKVDWVTPFEKETGCQVNVKIGNTSDEMVTLMRTGQYDGVSASGDATLRLIAGGDVAPVNTDLVPNYADVFPALKDQPCNSVDGQMYGIPHGRGANLLMWRTDKVKPAPDSLGRGLRPGRRQYKGKVTAYDNPIYIADAALYLKATKPDLGIDNPYELDDKQFEAAVDLLKQQRENIGEYWSDYTKEQAAFANGDSTVGTTWQVIANLLEADKVKVKTTLPKEGATGWSDTWMISLEGQAPELHVQVDGLDHLAEGQRRGGRVVRRGAVEREVVRGDRGQGPLRDLPRRRRGVLRQGRVLDDAAQGVRRRPRGGLQGLLRMGARPGRRSRAEAAGSPARRGAPSCSSVAAAGGAARLARRRLPRLARRPVRRGVLAARRVQRRDRQGATRSRTSRRCGRPTSTGRSPAHGRDRRRW